MVAQTRQAQSIEARPKRVPVGTRNVLTVKVRDPAYEYRFVNDLEDRIQMFKEGGWEVVTEDSQIGDKSVSDSSQISSAQTKAVGNGITAVLMRIRKEWYDEDIANQLKKVRRLHSELMEDARNKGLTNGTIKIE